MDIDEALQRHKAPKEVEVTQADLVEELTDAMDRMTEAFSKLQIPVHVNVPKSDIKPPVINVEAPIINLPAPIVTINQPREWVFKITRDNYNNLDTVTAKAIK